MFLTYDEFWAWELVSVSMGEGEVIHWKMSVLRKHATSGEDGLPVGRGRELSPAWNRAGCWADTGKQNS